MRRNLSSSLATLIAAATLLTGPAVAQTPASGSTDFTLQTDLPRTPEQEDVRLDRIDLALRVLPDDQSLRGVGALDFTALAPVDRLVVELDTVYAVTDVQVDGRTIAAEAWSNPEGRMTIQLPRALAAGETVALRIAYEGRPRVAPSSPWDGGFVWATAPGGEPWIGSAMQKEGCDLLFPCVDNSNAEPARADIHITVPSNLSAPANGVLVGKVDNGDGTTTWNWTARDPNIYAINVNVGPYDEVRADYQSRFGNVIPMHYWHLRSDRPEDVQRLFAEFPQMLDFFEQVIGPYPFADEKMGVVHTPYLGMEHQTINAYGNGYKIDERGYDWLLQHEFAHEWFANQLTNRNADDMWLHEGLGTYMQPLYAGWLRGDAYMQRELADQRDSLMNRAPVVSGVSLGVDDVSDGPGNDIYYKGSLVAHTLRMLVGDRDFFEALRILVYGRPDPRPGNFTTQLRSTPEFLEIVNRVTGRDHDWFFRAYLYEAALPVLTQTRDGGRIDLAWSTPAGVFPMPVEVEVDGVRRLIPMRDGRGFIEAPPGAVIRIDPENKVLRADPLADRRRTAGS